MEKYHCLHDGNNECRLPSISLKFRSRIDKPIYWQSNLVSNARLKIQVVYIEDARMSDS